MKLTFEIVTAGVWQCVERPEIQVRKMPRERLGRNGFALPGWAVFVSGIEVKTCGREATKRHAVENAEGFVDRQERVAAEADKQRERVEHFETVNEREERLDAERREGLRSCCSSLADGRHSKFCVSPEAKQERPEPDFEAGQLRDDRITFVITERGQAKIAALVAQRAVSADPATEDTVPELVDRIVRRAQYTGLKTVLDVLDGWIDGARENHEALSHRDSDCCRDFAPADIRLMVNDAARELRVPEPYRPEADR